MSTDNAVLAEAEFGRFVEKLSAFRGAMSVEERRLFDLLLLSAATADDGDVQGYLFGGVRAKHAALAAVFALGIVGGSLSPALGGSALAAPQEQPTLNGNRGGTSTASTSTTTSSQRTGSSTSVSGPTVNARTQPRVDTSGPNVNLSGGGPRTNPGIQIAQGPQQLGGSHIGSDAYSNSALQQATRHAQDAAARRAAEEAALERALQADYDRTLRAIEQQQLLQQQAQNALQRAEHEMQMALLQQQIDLLRQVLAAEQEARDAAQRAQAMNAFSQQLAQQEIAAGFAASNRATTPAARDDADDSIMNAADRLRRLQEEATGAGSQPSPAPSPGPGSQGTGWTR
jgi:hypothetical protein